MELTGDQTGGGTLPFVGGQGGATLAAPGYAVSYGTTEDTG
jgi:hypothetical protein